MKAALNIFLFLLFAGSLRAQAQDSLPVVDEVTRATVRADSVAKAELAHYQQEHHGRLSRGQLTLAAYDRNMSTFADGKGHFYVFDYDYNRPLGVLLYLLHFTVTVSTRTGRTTFKAQ